MHQQDFAGVQGIHVEVVIPHGNVEVARSFGIFSSRATSTFSLEPSRPSALANASACCATVSGLRFFTCVTVKCSSRRFADLQAVLYTK
jgi:hypothetical protein